MSIGHRLLQGLASLCFPEVCPCCGTAMVTGERVMCLSCRLDMPLTDYHLKPDFNRLMERLICRTPIERSGAMMHYERMSPYARLIHAAKYGGRPSIARELAREYSAAIAPSGFFDGIDAIVPVPLSRLKLIRRGYNQSLHIARGVAEATGLPVIDVLKARSHASQTRKDARQRYLNASGIYQAAGGVPEGVNHLLLVDDIITTGATVCACAEAIGTARSDVKISVLALAATRLA